MGESTILSARAKIAEHRRWIYLLLAGIGIFILFPQLVGFNRTIQLLARADSTFLALALITEALRYVFSAGTTRVLARLFHRTIPIEPLTEAFFAGAAANRTFSTGGAPGMLIRLLFLAHQEVTAGAVAVIFLIEDVAGFTVGGLIFLAGAVTLVTAHRSEQFIVNVAVICTAGSVALVLAAIAVSRQRPWVERGVHALARVVNRFLAWLNGRPPYTRDQVQRGLDDFYAGVALARHAPKVITFVFGLNLLRTVAGMAALYFAFLAIGWAINPAVLILLYTSVSVLSTVSALPGELAIMGGSWAILTLSFGVPRDIAMTALLLSRSIAFWLPIPIGYAALWNLRRLHYL